MTKTLQELMKIIESQTNLIKDMALKIAEQENLIDELLRG